MSTPFMGELRIMSFNFAPKGWTQCNGQLLPINQNQALFSLLGTTYGGDGRVNFGLPKLQGRVPLGFGNGFIMGEQGGEYAHTLNTSEMTQHNHIMWGLDGNANTPTSAPTASVAKGHSTATGQPPVDIFGTAQPNRIFAPGAITNAGGSQPHANLQPYLCLNVCIALQGIFPSQN
jgi:microcystin-dependent protein